MTTHQKKQRFLTLSLATLGVVYGDIGTSPLYALKESLHGIPIIPENVLGVLSLIFWSLILVVSIKYLIFILRADNDGEGGILALLALLKRTQVKGYKFIFGVGILGAGLLIGDAMLTPAISIISAIEGLKTITPALTHFIIPITIFILFVFFTFQYLGTAQIGKFFGPILFVWFITIAILGGVQIFHHPNVLKAIYPYYAINFFLQNGWTGYNLLGGVFLVMTGTEALYADLGHFGKLPIRLNWFTIVLPALLLNYFGQGAYLLGNPDAVVNPFYALVSGWHIYPLILLATIATIIASQAVVTATFSLTKQAVLLGLYPKIPIIQTSAQRIGQIYIPQMNFILGMGTILLVLTFKNSSALAHAYGIAVNLVMFAVTIMVTYLAYHQWRWSLLKIMCIMFIFILIDLSFLGANIEKIITGGWVPLLFAAFCAIVMITWRQGIEHLRKFYYKEKVDLAQLIQKFDYSKIYFLPESTAIFITDPYDQSGGAFLHYLKLNHIMPEKVLIISIVTENYPYINHDKHYEIQKISQNIFRLTLHYGFMQLIHIPKTLENAEKLAIFPFKLDFSQIIFFIEIAQVSATRRKSTLTFFWQEKLFAFLMRNAALDIEFFHLPYNRTIAIGNYCEI